MTAAVAPAPAAPTRPTLESGIATPVGVVAIGRNEGERLVRCLRSVSDGALLRVYVDSGSTDGSTEAAAALGAEVVCLDPLQQFTAARARNRGLEALLKTQPTLQFVQFVDGDCEVVDGWIACARRFLERNPDVAAVCGRRRERHPDRSVYNLLCDMEWDTPVGPAPACGGDVMMRVEALLQVGAYRADLIAGEEPELCVRLRQRGWRIWRLDAEMTRHDAAMLRFAQWWKRSERAGHAFAEGRHLHGAPPERHWVRETRSAQLWGFGVPLLAAGACLLLGPGALAVLAVYPVQVVRLAWRGEGSLRRRLLRSSFLVLGKFPEALGVLRFERLRRCGTRATLIEYK